jgi:lactobin A/cerein 7B family class IIb bacteriocin
MKELSLNQMEMVSGGRLNWKCILGGISVIVGAALAATGVGLAVAGDAVGDGLGFINSNCPTRYS